MPIVYNILYVLLVTLLIWLLVLGLGAFLLKKLILKVKSFASLSSLIYVLITVILLPMILNVSNIVLQVIQTQIAKPYIEAAINDEKTAFSVDEGRVFYDSSQLKWRSSDTKLLCVYRVNWECKKSKP